MKKRKQFMGSNSHVTELNDIVLNKSLTYAYNINGQLQKIEGDFGSVGYRYDKSGRPAEVFDPAGRKITYAYDAAGRRTKVKDALQNDTVYKYDPNDNLEGITFANGAATTYVYTDRDEVESVEDALGNKLEQEYDEVVLEGN